MPRACDVRDRLSPRPEPRLRLGYTDTDGGNVRSGVRQRRANSSVERRQADCGHDMHTVIHGLRFADWLAGFGGALITLAGMALWMLRARERGL